MGSEKWCAPLETAEKWCARLEAPGRYLIWIFNIDLQNSKIAYYHWQLAICTCICTCNWDVEGSKIWGNGSFLRKRFDVWEHGRGERVKTEKGGIVKIQSFFFSVNLFRSLEWTHRGSGGSLAQSSSDSFGREQVRSRYHNIFFFFFFSLKNPLKPW